MAAVEPMGSPRAASRVLLRVRGTVQGVGFRPFVHRTASRLGLHGWVRNDPDGVLVRAEGPTDALQELVSSLRRDAPAAARVEEVQDMEPEAEALERPGEFVIRESALPGSTAAAGIPPDLAICADCRRELADPFQRRFRYPFTNCTQCGPRYSIIESLPYDRVRTTMRCFRMCPDCAQEYADPSDRRFHAEPIACPACGPQLALADPDGRTLAQGENALADAAWALLAGRIVAVKGLGGFHLMCNAANAAAVAQLRRRKHRDEKPLAVMFRDLAEVRVHADVSADAARLLESPAAPIVLVPRRPDAAIAPAVAPGNPWIGAFLAATPLHVLLLHDCGRPLVATSANLSSEPLCIGNAEARERLRGIADLFLEHDRAIARPIDDSVMRLAGPDPIVLRRARGLAPRSLRLPGRLPAPVLCLGGQLKNTVALAQEDEVTLSPHLGDLDAAPTRELFRRTIGMLTELRHARCGLVVHDQHPDYASTALAESFGLPTLAVQHHLAHVLAGLLEHGHPADDVLGIAWDGTGHGPDGTVWGGEFIALRRGRAERFARLRPFRLPGGEAAVRDARRVALALAEGAGLRDAARARLGFTEREEELLCSLLRIGLASPVTSSAGRLFDGVGALLGLGRFNSFEGQVPLAVEAAVTAAESGTEDLVLPVGPAESGGALFEIDWRPAVAAALRPDLDAPRAARALHQALAAAMVDVAQRAGLGTVLLTGGCFQNALLHSLAVAKLSAAGFRVLAHRSLSPNDNSIAAGQALAALWNLTSVHLPSRACPAG